MKNEENDKKVLRFTPTELKEIFSEFEIKTHGGRIYPTEEEFLELKKKKNKK